MPRKEFASGIAPLDDLVSGFRPGDTVLAIIGQQGSWDFFTAPFSDEARERRIPVVVVSPQQIIPAGKKKTPAAVITSAKRFLSSKARASLVVVEELSLWRDAFKAEKHLHSFFEMLVESSAKNGSLTLIAASRGAFSLETLARFKDLPAISLELAGMRDETIILPLHLKGRYAPLKSVPLRLRNFHRTPDRRANEDTSAPAGGDVSSQDLFPDARYKEVFENAGEAMILFTLRGEYRRANARALTLLGVNQDEFLRRNPVSLVPAAERNRLLRLLIQLRRKKSASGAFTLLRENKGALSVESRCAPVGGDYYIAILHETGEHVALERELRRSEQEYRSLVEKHPDGIAVLLQNELVLANAEFCRLFGISGEPGEQNLRIKELFTVESWRKLQKAISGQAELLPGRIELWCSRRDATTFIANVGYAAVQFRGKWGVELSVADNTLQKKLLDSIAASESRFRSMIEGSRTPQAMVREGRIEVANAAAVELFGMEAKGTLNGVELSRLVDEPSRPLLEPLILVKGGGRKLPASLKLYGLRGGGAPFEMEISAALAAASGSLLLSFRDVSDESAVEKEAAIRRYEIAKLTEVSEALDITLGREKLLHACTDRLVSALSWEFGAVYAADARSKELVLEHDRHASVAFKEKLSSLPLAEGLGGFMEKTREPIFIQMKKYPSHLAHRKVFQELGLQSLLILPLVTRSSFGGMIILGSKKEKEAQLHSPDLLAAISGGIGTALANASAYSEIDRLAKERHELIDSVAPVLYITAPNGRITYVGSGIAQLTGFTDREFYKDASMLLKLVHPDDKGILLGRTVRLDEIRARESAEYRILPRGRASYRTVRDEFSCVRDGNGSVTSVHGAITDITEEKERSEQVVSMFSQDRNALNSIREGVFIIDRKRKVIHWNDGMERITGKKGADLLGRSPSDVFPQSEQQRFSQLIEEAYSGEEVRVDDIRYSIPDSGRIGYLWGRFAPVKDSDGSITGVVCLVTDFTDRKQLELDMRDSEQVLRNVIDTMGDVLLIADLKGNVLEVNTAFLRVLGYSRSESIGHEFPYRWVLEEEMGKFVLWIAELRERNWLHDFDMTWRAKDGRLIPMSLSTTLLRNSMGEPIATLNIARDITERKRLTKDLESRTRQIEMINRIISKANETLDFDEIFHSIAAEIDEVLASDLINIGILTEDERSLTVYPLKGSQEAHKGDTIPIEQSLSRIAITSGKPAVVPDLSSALEFRSYELSAKELRSQISFPIVLKGKAFGALNIGSRTPNAYADGDAHILQPIAQQIGTIIDRVQLFRQVTEDSAYIHALLDSIGSIVYTVDTQYRIREVNKAWHDFMQDSGFPGIRNYQGLNLFDVLPSQTLKEMFRPVVGDIVAGKLSVYVQEFVHATVTGDRFYQLTINPMTIDRKVTGLVFTHSDITALKKTEKQLKRSNEQLLALNRISTLISTSLDLTEILDTTIPLLHKETESQAVLVYLFEQYTHELRLAKEVGFASSGRPAAAALAKGSSVTGTVMLTKEPVYISERAHMDERVLPEKREILRMVRLEAMAVVPLASKNQVWGALEIFYDRPHEFSPQEQQMLSLVGNQLGTAIENAQLYQELRSQINRLTVLYEISQHLTSTLEIDEIFSAVHESIRHVVPYETMIIALYDAGTASKTVVFRASPSKGAKIVDTARRKAELLKPGSAEAIVVETKLLHRDPEFHTVYVPMFSKEAIIGIMSVRGAPTTALTETHLRLLESVGNLTALAVEKAKLYEETLKISLEIQRRNKELDDFTYVVSHDLKEPLISIEGFSRIIQADYREIIQEEGKDYLDSIVGATTRMKGLIDDLLMLSRVSRPSEAFKPVALAKVFEDITTDMEFTIRQKKVTFVVPQPLPVVYGNEIQLLIVFRNLIGNAIKFNDKADPKVEVGFQIAENNMYLFHVKDNGIGIAKDFFEKVFVIFQRLHRREEYEGTGAGLAIVKKIIETHKGRIWIESDLGKGSTFFFTIPKGTPHDG